MNCDVAAFATRNCLREAVRCHKGSYVDTLDPTQVYQRMAPTERERCLDVPVRDALDPTQVDQRMASKQRGRVVDVPVRDVAAFVTRNCPRAGSQVSQRQSRGLSPNVLRRRTVRDRAAQYRGALPRAATQPDAPVPANASSTNVQPWR